MTNTLKALVVFGAAVLGSVTIARQQSLIMEQRKKLADKEFELQQCAMCLKLANITTEVLNVQNEAMRKRLNIEES